MPGATAPWVGWISSAVVVGVSVTLLVEAALSEDVVVLLLFTVCVATF